MSTFSLEIDNATHVVDVDDDTPLLYVLRDDLGFKNPRFGCGLAQCGACTVLVGGEPVRSCATAVADIGKAEITTLHGLSANGHPHKIQAAFIEEQTPQCGYCLNGWLLTAAALLDRNPHPTDAEIRDALSTLICRCGTHMAIIRAVKRASLA
jgi:aerobic-type carbon monoxide dehydrogenase small subunit (CoxS/CutS family)